MRQAAILDVYKRQTGSDELERAKTTAGDKITMPIRAITFAVLTSRGGTDCDNPCHNHGTSAENQQP